MAGAAVSVAPAVRAQPGGGKRRNVLLLSDHQQGKSSFLGHVYLRDLIEQRQLITFNFVLQKNVSPLAIQSQFAQLAGAGLFAGQKEDNAQKNQQR